MSEMTSERIRGLIAGALMPRDGFHAAYRFRYVSCGDDRALLDWLLIPKPDELRPQTQREADNLDLPEFDQIQNTSPKVVLLRPCKPHQL